MLTDDQKQVLKDAHSNMWEALARSVSDIRDDIAVAIDDWEDDWIFDKEKIALFDLHSRIEDIETTLNRFEEAIKRVNG